MLPKRETGFAGQEIVHAKDQRSSEIAMGAGVRSPADRAQLLNQPGDSDDYLQRAEQAGLSWPLPQDLDDQELERRLFKSPFREPALRRALPEFAHMHEQLQRHKHLTLQLLWEEYRQAEPNGYAYSFFCELYRDWQRKQDLVLRQEHKAGEKMFVDWAGPTIPLHDRESGKVGQASLFVAVLGASCYTYAEATPDQQMAAG